MNTFKGIVRHHEPLAPYTTWHIGGPADLYYRPTEPQDLALFLASRPKDEPITFLGLGSNVLISDQGLRGTVVHLLSASASLKINDSEPKLRVDASVPCAQLAKFCAKHGFLGAEFFAGIPGTLGGAMAMNAGAWGSETWTHLVEVEVVNRQGQCFRRWAKDYKIRYRQVITPYPDEWFMAGYFDFKPGGDSVAIRAKIKALLKTRSEKQPIGVFSCGSVFKNPPNDYAARLIEASKLKGIRRGGAVVSTKHANFIINEGKACAQDVYDLIFHIQAIVLHEHQVLLEPELRFLGF